MATTTTYTGGIQRWDLTEVLQILQQDMPSLLSLVSIGEPINSTTPYWHTLTKTNKGSTANGAITAGDGTILVVDGSKFSDGDLILIKDKTPETFRVTESAHTLTLLNMAGAGATCAYNHDSATAILNISTPRLEARELVGARPDFATKLHNHTQIFSKELIVSGTVDNVRLEEANDTRRYFTEQKMIEIYKEINYQLLFGQRYEGTDAHPRTMGGLWWWLTDTTHGTPISTNLAGGLTLTAINDLAERSYNLGGRPDTIICNTTTARRITKLAQDASGFTINVSREEDIAGNTIVGIQADWVGGGLRQIVVDASMPTGALFLTNSKKLTLAPLINRAIGMEELAKTGDSTKYLVLGEYTLKIGDPYNDHGYLFNFTTV